MSIQSSHQVAVIGAGVIGLSWASLFAAKGHVVNIFDIRSDLREQLQKKLPVFIPQVPNAGQSLETILSRVQAVSDLAAAVEGARVVQESGPENPGFKRSVWAQIEKAVPEDALLLSSSSGIVASIQSADMRNPERLVIGHPFNPPHILPLVEISSDAATPQALIDRAMAFYRSLGKTPVQLHKEVPGFVANRLQIALVLEAIKLVNQGVVSITELDDIVTASLGIRWASIGPLKAFHLGGGEGGLRHLLTHIGISLAEAVGQPGALSQQDIEQISQAAEQAYPFSRFDDFQAQRDHGQAVIIADHLIHPVHA